LTRQPAKSRHAWSRSAFERHPASASYRQTWFVDVTETHTSLPALVFFRSPHWEHSWVTASGAVLDGASLLASTVDPPRSADAELCIRAGYVATGTSRVGS
jgi:hypothetical protein